MKTSSLFCFISTGKGKRKPNSSIVESRFLEPPGETKIGSRNREWNYKRSKSKGNKVWFEISGGSSNRGFEKSGFHCIIFNSTNATDYTTCPLSVYYLQRENTKSILWCFTVKSYSLLYLIGNEVQKACSVSKKLASIVARETFTRILTYVLQART